MYCECSSLKQAGTMRSFLIVFLAAYVLACVEGKMFSPCEMVQELLKNGVDKNDMSKWMCLIKAESYYDTMSKIKRRDGTMCYGLFQICDKEGCADGTTPGGMCQVTCKELLGDDISASVKCAMTMMKQVGFKSWPGYMEMCEGHEMEDYSFCY